MKGNIFLTLSKGTLPTLCTVLCMLFTATLSIAAVSVDIISPGPSDVIRPNTKYTFLIFLTNTGDTLPSTATRLDVNIAGGTVLNTDGTSNTHFSEITPNEAGSVAFQSTNDFPGNTSKIAVVTLRAGELGVLTINASAHVDGTTASDAFSETIETDLGFTEAPRAYFELAYSRKELTDIYIQMYRNYMNDSSSGNLYSTDLSREDFAAQLAELNAWTGRVIQATEILTAFVQNPAAGLFSLYLELLGEAVGQPNLMDVVSLIDTFGDKADKFNYHYCYFCDETKPLVNIDHLASIKDLKGSLEELSVLQQAEADAWYRKLFEAGEEPTVFEILAKEKEFLQRVKDRAGQTISEFSLEDGALAFFTMIANYAEAELKVVESLRAKKILFTNHPPSFPAGNPLSPENPGFDASLTPTLEWNCTDADGDPIAYTVYLENMDTGMVIELDAGQQSTLQTGILQPKTTYQWWVKATDMRQNSTIGNTEAGLSSTVSEKWAFTTGPAFIHNIELLYVPEQGQVGKAVEVDVFVKAIGLSEARLTYSLRDNAGNPVLVFLDNTVANSPESQHFKKTFSWNASGNYTFSASLRGKISPDDSETLLDSAAMPISIIEDPKPALIEIQVEGISDDSPYFYDSGPLKVFFLVWDDGDLASLKGWMHCAFSEGVPTVWEAERELRYQGTESYSCGGNTFDVARLFCEIPSAAFGSRADGKRAIWIKPLRFQYDQGQVTSPDLSRVVKVEGKSIRDDDTRMPEVIFDGADAAENSYYMVLTSKRSEVNIHVADVLVIQEDGSIEDYSSGLDSLTFSHAFTDTKPADPDSIPEENFVIDKYVDGTSAPFQGYTYSAYMNLAPGRETQWLTYRVHVDEADNDWTGDDFVFSRYWIGQVPDDDTEGPVIGALTYPASVQYNQLLPITCTVYDDSGLALNPTNGKYEVSLYWRFGKYGSWEGPYYYTYEDGAGNFEFSFPPVGSSHINQTFYFYVRANDGDNERTDDASSTIADNGGAYYTVSIIDETPPTIEGLTLENNATVSGNVRVSADVSDADTTAVTVKINGKTVSDALPFVWNTTIPAWHDPITVATGADAGGHQPSIVSAGGSELWISYIQNGALYVKHSADGISWDSPVPVATPLDMILNATLLRDASGALWCAYRDYAQDDYRMSLFVSSSTDNGLTWSAPVQATSGIDVVGHSLIRASDSTFWYAFYFYDENWNTEIAVASSPDGVHWSQPLIVDPNTNWDSVDTPLIAEAPDGAICVFYRKTAYVDGESLYEVLKSTSTDGVSWSTPAPVSYPADGSYIYPENIFQDGAGNYWMVYTVLKGYAYLVPSEDLTNWGAPAALGELAAPVSITHTANGPYWGCYKSGNEIYLIGSSSEKTHTITIYAEDASGNSVSETITVTVADVIIPGDIDYDGTVNLKDALLALKISCHRTPGIGSVNKAADVNRDHRIGIEEAAYILRYISR